MVRFKGVNLDDNKHLEISLTGLYGIGRSSARKICESVSLPYNSRFKDLSEDKINEIRSFIDSNYSIEGELLEKVIKSVKLLKELGCYRGIRHRKGLPVRGQRTRSNARTRKGKAVPIAGKKK